LKYLLPVFMLFTSACFVSAADETGSRLVGVSLIGDPSYGFIPQYQGKRILAEPVFPKVTTVAQGQLEVQGINTLVVGESCEVLRANHPALSACEATELQLSEYGPVEAAAYTDTEGFAALSLQVGQPYRLRLESWQTAEDAACLWTGFGELSADALSTTIELVVLCE